MKLSKIKSIFLALSAALVLAAIYIISAVSGGTAFAEENKPSLNEYEGYNFVYSAEFTPANEAKKVSLVFGAAENSYFSAVADLAGGKVKLLHSKDGDLKTADYKFEANGNIQITLVMNEDIAKIYINDDGTAVICCKVDNYVGGKLGVNCDGFDVNKVAFTDMDLPECDIYCNGYDVLKVVNITDGNCKLDDDKYTVEKGLLKISRDYLKTLEAGKEYTFRVVTSFTDFDFKITNDFTAVTVTPAVDKYYRDNDVTLELSGNVKVYKLFIDGKECDKDKFTVKEGTVVISSEETALLSTGSHSVKLYTDKGRPETTITVSEMVETVTEPAVKATHVFLWIDLAIFLSAIIGYTAFSIISKRKKK